MKAGKRKRTSRGGRGRRIEFSLICETKRKIRSLKKLKTSRRRRV